MKTIIQEQKQKNKRGVVLILAMFVMVALSLLTITSFELLTGSIRIAKNHKEDLQALYVAEAGIEEGVKRMRATGTCSSFGPETWAGYQYTVTVETVDSDLKFTSVGSVGYFQRTLEARVKVVETPEFPVPHNYSVAVMYWKEKEM
jgi:Tfp pilus assembly protein PilX